MNFSCALLRGWVTEEIFHEVLVDREQVEMARTLLHFYPRTAAHGFEIQCVNTRPHICRRSAADRGCMFAWNMQK